MDQANKKKLNDIISKEIGLEDDMLALYSAMIEKESCLALMPENDKNICHEIISELLRDTARHKVAMKEVLDNL